MSMLRTLALGLAGYSLYSTLRDRRRARAVVAKPEPLQRWEGEGGHVPAANPAVPVTSLNLGANGSSTAPDRTANAS